MSRSEQKAYSQDEFAFQSEVSAVPALEGTVGRPAILLLPRYNKSSLLLVDFNSDGLRTNLPFGKQHHQNTFRHLCPDLVLVHFFRKVKLALKVSRRPLQPMIDLAG